MEFDLAGAWALHPAVSVRREPFGALAYHYDTRRLSFLRSTRLLLVVSTLDTHADALTACHAAGVTDEELPRYRQALAVLAETAMIVPRETKQ